MTTGAYFRTPQMMEGKGFRCYNCGKLLAVKLDGSEYEVEFKCPRCKAFIRVKMREKVPWKTPERIERPTSPQ